MSEPRASQQALHDAITTQGEIVKMISRLLVEDMTSVLAKQQLWMLERFDDQGTGLKAIHGDLTVLVQSAQESAARLGKLEDGQASLELRHDAIAGQVNDLGETVDELRSDVTTQFSDVHAQFSDVRGQLTRVNDRLDGHDKLFESILSEIASMQATQELMRVWQDAQPPPERNKQMIDRILADDWTGNPGESR